LTAIYDAALEPAGISVAQFSLLRSIGRATPLSLTKLGKMVDLDRSTVGRNVRVIERMGLVRITHGPDQREATMALTGQGIDALRRATPLWEQAQCGIEASLGPAASAQLAVLLESL
jgi:DNA-binding MarR family transcriptional regulator